MLNTYLEQLYTMATELDVYEYKRHKIVSFMGNMPCICFIKSGDTGKYEYVNSEFCAIVNKSEVDIIGKRDLDLFDVDMARRNVAYDLLVLKNKTKIAVINKFKDKVWLVVKFIVVNGGEAIGGIGIELPNTFTLNTDPANVNGKESN